MNIRCHRSRAAGFTLTELMVTIVIIGIFAAMALVSVRKDRDEATLDGFAKQIRNLMVAARRRAVSTGSTYLVDVSATSVQYCQLDPANPAQTTCPTPLAALCPPANQPCEFSKKITVGPGVAVAWWAKTVDIGQAPGKNVVAPDATIFFFRDGTSDFQNLAQRPPVGAGATIYVAATSNALKKRKIAVYPVSGMVKLTDSW